MCVYHDITKKFNPNKRPLIMSNVQGIDHGNKNYPSEEERKLIKAGLNPNNRSKDELIAIKKDIYMEL